MPALEPQAARPRAAVATSAIPASAFLRNFMGATFLGKMRKVGDYLLQEL